MVRPPFPWNGAKTRLIDTLEPYIRSWGGNGRWIEPFLGSGVVARHVRMIFPDIPMIVGDTNPWLMAAHEHWLSGDAALPTLDDVSEANIERFRNYTNADFDHLTDRDKALRFLVCLYSAWGNRWQTKDDGEFITPINTAREGADPDFLCRRLRESHGCGSFNKRDTLLAAGWFETAKHAVPGDLVFLDSPYPETAGYGLGWDLSHWSEMYLWVRDKAIPKGIHVLVCNPGTLTLLWDELLQHSEGQYTTPQGRSTAARVEYIGYCGPWVHQPNVLDLFGTKPPKK